MKLAGATGAAGAAGAMAAPTFGRTLSSPHIVRARDVDAGDILWGPSGLIVRVVDNVVTDDAARIRIESPYDYRTVDLHDKPLNPRAKILVLARGASHTKRLSPTVSNNSAEVVDGGIP